MRQNQNPWVVIGAVLGGLGVAMGAFGAHGLEVHLAKSGNDSARLLGIWDTASEYQMMHALALLAVGLLAARGGGRSVWLAGMAMTLGTLVFSGCLYALVLSGQKWLGAVVPIGGVLMIVGWVFLAVGAVREVGKP